MWAVRKDVYNVQILQNWKTCRWSRVTLLSDPAANLIRMKVHVFSDFTLCVGVSSPDASNWATLRGWICRKINLAAREVLFIFWAPVMRGYGIHNVWTPVTPDTKCLVSRPCWNLYLRCQLFESLSPCCCHDVPCEQQWTHSVFWSVEESECFKHALL